MDRQNEQKLTVQPDFGRDILDKPFLTIGEVASLLQVSSRTVYNLIYSGTLRACRITYHITLITKEDFFLMIKETTYCKRSVSVFAKQGKKTKGKMKKDVQKTEETALTRQEGKTKAKGSPAKRRLIPAANYKQSVRDTFTDRERVAGDLYTMAEICQKFNYTYGRFYNLRMRYSIPCIKANATKCFPKAEVDKVWRRKRNAWATTFRNIGIRASTSCACSDWAKHRCAGSPSPTGYGQSAYTATACTT